MLDGQPLGEYPELGLANPALLGIVTRTPPLGIMVRLSDVPIGERYTWN